jgi:hypothetical protein
LRGFFEQVTGSWTWVEWAREEGEKKDEPLDVIRSGLSSSSQSGRAALMSSVRREGVDGESEVVD